jgi:hypothetical protein
MATARSQSSRPPRNRYYVYEHWRPDEDACFYVGKGCANRAHVRNRSNRAHLDIQRKLAKIGMCYEVRLVASGLTEEEAYSLECKRISFWRLLEVKLANKTMGGKGVRVLKRRRKSRIYLDFIVPKTPAPTITSKGARRTRSRS